MCLNHCGSAQKENLGVSCRWISSYCFCTCTFPRRSKQLAEEGEVIFFFLQVPHFLQTPIFQKEAQVEYQISSRLTEGIFPGWGGYR